MSTVEITWSSDYHRVKPAVVGLFTDHVVGPFLHHGRNSINVGYQAETHRNSELKTQPYMCIASCWLTHDRAITQGLLDGGVVRLWKRPSPAAFLHNQLRARS